MTLSRQQEHLTRNGSVYWSIREKLLTGHFEPGERFRLSDLCAEYDVSMTVVRESLTRLEGKGLIKSQANKGYWVPSYTQEEIADQAFVRSHIESLAIQLSVEFGDVEWGANLVAAGYRLSITPRASSVEDPGASEQWTEAHRSFHDAVCAACGSQELLRYRSQLFDQSELMRQMISARSVQARDVEAEHAAIGNAALARDAAAAADLMRQHLAATAQAAAKVLEQES